MSTEREQVEIEIDEDMDANQRSWLMTKLEKERGIISAVFKGGDHHRLAIHYEHKHFSRITLLDTIKEHGFHGRFRS